MRVQNMFDETQAETGLAPQTEAFEHGGSADHDHARTVITRLFGHGLVTEPLPLVADKAFRLDIGDDLVQRLQIGGHLRPIIAQTGRQQAFDDKNIGKGRQISVESLRMQLPVDIGIDGVQRLVIGKKALAAFGIKL